jgi:predicted metal-dependent hydrolase
MFKLKDYLYENIDKFPEMKEYIKQLYLNLNKDRTLIYENDPKSDLTSFSVNKGEEIALCLKSKKTGSLHQINLLMYVTIHEMAHVACPEIGHGELFKKIFKFLCEQSIKIGIYKYDDYQNNPIEYCGMMLSSSII